MTTAKSLLILCCVIASITCCGQANNDSLLTRKDGIKFSAAVDKKVSKLEKRISSRSQKVLARTQKSEEKVYRRLLRTKDSAQAKIALDQMRGKYDELRVRLSGTTGSASHYIPRLDTIQTALKFLNVPGAGSSVSNALEKTQQLQNKFQQAELIKQFIRQRKQKLQEQFAQLGIARQLKRINKQAYYYAAQIKEYRSLLKDSKKAERKALALLSKTKVFKDFMRKNSQLASLFRLPGDPNDPQSAAYLAGLQTRAQVNTFIQQQIAAGGPGAQEQFRQNLLSGQAQLNQLKDKVTQLGGGSSSDILPEGFKPNDQKTKSFWKRLEYGTNFQSQKATNLCLNPLLAGQIF